MIDFSPEDIERRITEAKKKTSRRLGGEANPSKPPYLSRTQAARRLGKISPRTFDQWAEKAGLQSQPHPKDSKKNVFPTPQVEALLDNKHNLIIAQTSAHKLFGGLTSFLQFTQRREKNS